MGQSPAAVHPQAVPNRGHVHILRLQAQVQLGHVITEPGRGVVVREAVVLVFTVQVHGSDLGQVFTTGVQIVVVLEVKENTVNILPDNPSEGPIFRPLLFILDWSRVT